MDFVQLPSVKNSSEKIALNDRERKLKEASKQLEGVFLSFVLKSMQKTLHKGALSESENNLASMMFSSMMGKEIAEQRGIGLADKIYEAMLQQEDVDLDELKEKLELNAFHKYEQLRLKND